MSKGLGRGLDALISSVEIANDEKIFQIPIQELRPNPYQPRKTFDPDSIEELKRSIMEHGVIQPIIVRKSIKGYDIIAGERRYRASQAAHLKTIPAVLKEFTESEMMEIALIENLQREDLNSIEIAIAYQKLMEKFDLTQEELAQKVGKSRPHVANFIRLLHLPDIVQDYVSRGTLSMGHARALLGIKEQKRLIQLAEKCVALRLSVRQLELLVKEEDVSRETKKKRIPKKRDLFLEEYEKQLRSRLGTAVKIKKGHGKGKIEIDFLSNEDLERIMDMLEVHINP